MQTIWLWEGKAWVNLIHLPQAVNLGQVIIRMEDNGSLVEVGQENQHWLQFRSVIEQVSFLFNLIRYYLNICQIYCFNVNCDQAGGFLNLIWLDIKYYVNIMCDSSGKSFFNLIWLDIRYYLNIMLLSLYVVRCHKDNHIHRILIGKS